MQNGSNPDDRRQSIRRTAKDGVFLTFRPRFQKVGKLVDICSGGLAVEYLLNPEAVDAADHLPDNTVEVDVFSSGEQVYIRRIKCRVVYDTGVDAFGSLDSIQMRRCGLQFEPTSQQQLPDLSCLMTSTMSTV
jgi:hypothetical protein